MIANSILIVSMMLIIVGAIGINRLKGIIPKMLTSSLIDTMAMLLLVIALVMKTGFNGMGVRLIIVLVFILLTTPVINHMMASAAYDATKEKGESDD